MALSHTLHPNLYGRHHWDGPQRLVSQDVGLDLSEFHGMYCPKALHLAQTSGASEVINDHNKFEVRLDVKHFKPEEIKVKTIDNYIVISGKHEERADEHGFITREFTRRYALPHRCDPQMIVSSLKSDGILTIEAPKSPLDELKANERHIPIDIK